MSHYIPLTKGDQHDMLKGMGLSSTEELFDDIPKQFRLQGPLNIPGPFGEHALKKSLYALSQMNAHALDYTYFLGAGIYDHFIPAAVQSIIGRSEFYTAYTPYQAEISQGTLQAIFEFQTMICELTGMDCANASMYDGATACAEAALMACRTTGKTKLLASSTMHPQALEVLECYCRFAGLNLALIPSKDGTTDTEHLLVDAETAGVIVQSPNFYGLVESLADIKGQIHLSKALMIVSVDPISLSLLAPPSDFGADIVVGEGQALGNTMSFGGPSLGFLAARKALLRKMPGRIIGQTSDIEGRRAFVMTLQTREQHIRRDKATSNICSNQSLNALTACVYMSLMGKQGMREAAEQCLQKSHYAYTKLTQLDGVSPLFEGSFFKEFALQLPISPDIVNARLLEQKIIGGFNLSRFGHNNAYLIAVTEKRSKQEIDVFVEAVREVINEQTDF